MRKREITLRSTGMLLFSAGIFLLAIAAGCRSRKKVVAAPTDTVHAASNCHLDHRQPNSLVAGMKKSEFQFDWFSAKLSCEAGDDSSKFNFDVAVRIRRDSMIWLNVTAQDIPVKIARVLVTRDSVKFVQYQDGTLGAKPKCFQGDFAYLSQLLQTDIDYDMMQSLLVGNSVSFYEEEEKLHASVNAQDCNYTLSTIRKHKLKKVLQGQKLPDEPLQTISLDPVTFKILKIFFVDAQNRTFTANYSNFDKQDSLLLPHKAVFFAKGPHRSVTLNATYKKININQPLEFPFTIPDDCTPINISPQRQPGNDGH